MSGADRSTETRGLKRGADGGSGDGGDDKRTKTKKQWRVPRKNDRGYSQAQAIQPGDSGIWATCTRGKEAKSVSELRELFFEYAEELYKDAISTAATINAVAGESGGSDTATNGGEVLASAPAPVANDESDDDEAGLSIEDAIKAEVSSMKQSGTKSGNNNKNASAYLTASLFTNVKMTVPCLIFFRTRAPIEPVPFVTRICSDALPQPNHLSKSLSLIRTRPRHIQRLTPIQSTCFASAEALSTLAETVLEPYFSASPVSPSTAGATAEASLDNSRPVKTFAIRANIRNNNSLHRNTIFSTVASAVGSISSATKVDLSNPRVLILVEVYQNVVGMGVIDEEGGGGAAHERLKRFNLQEIWDVRAKQAGASDEGSAGDGAVSRVVKNRPTDSPAEKGKGGSAASGPSVLPAETIKDPSSMDTS
ncbi:hypothetical protein K431DRAFT_288737 [Polychaeton citri CBS 116435]|uniref:THUMP domain-containing protein n=1 Tax=Polychaeton citri CBS 116435 TaxID=1314669 RepID=A0A9P4Q2D7_9PEZI|nr:hypothetical protein K431DRAFT_288737 [Polychaeton citri CBS 116435]